MEEVTLNICENSVFIHCARPVSLSDELEMVINISDSARSIEVIGEVVWSNIYGSDDKITPRGIGIRFTKIADTDRKFLSTVVADDFNARDSEWL